MRTLERRIEALERKEPKEQEVIVVHNLFVSPNGRVDPGPASFVGLDVDPLYPRPGEGVDGMRKRIDAVMATRRSLDGLSKKALMAAMRAGELYRKEQGPHEPLPKPSPNVLARIN